MERDETIVMDSIQKGDRVKFISGRGGMSEGRVVNIADGMATIETKNQHLVNRKLARLEKIHGEAVNV